MQDEELRTIRAGQAIASPAVSFMHHTATPNIRLHPRVQIMPGVV